MSVLRVVAGVGVEGLDRFEPVHVVRDAYDGVLQGMADLHGRPHRFRRRFDIPGDEYSDVFELVPLDEAVVELELERWHIWLRWKAALQRGEIGLETHPVLPSERQRHQALLSGPHPGLMKTAVGPVVFARGEFRTRQGGAPRGGPNFDLEVRWSKVTGGEEAA